MKKIELSHDIIAEKIWERIPENDKRLQEIKRRLRERIKDYDAGSGSLLGHQELIAWKDLLDELSKDKAAKNYLDKSKQYQDRQNWLRRATILAIFLIAIVSVISAGVAFVQWNKGRVLLKEVVRRDLAEIDELILRLDYQGAWSRLQKTAELGVYADSIAMKMAEPAFFYGEAGDQQRAKGMLDTLAEFSNNKRMRQLLLSWPDQDSVSRKYLQREIIIALDDSITYKTLTARYYPEMVFVRGGTFTMGCTEEQGGDCFEDENPAHQVTLDDFWMAKTETTVWQWAVYEQFTKGGSRVLDITASTRGNYPKIEISWLQAIAYAEWLSEISGYDIVYKNGNYVQVERRLLPIFSNFIKKPIFMDSVDALHIETQSNGYRLPWESEWEYAARGGISNEVYKYAGSDIPDLVAWHWDNLRKTNPVSEKQANELGLYDMSGNVWEWCNDWYGNYSLREQRNPKGPSKGTYRVARGGGWDGNPEYCRVSTRGNYDPSIRNGGLGFRLARSSNQ